MLGCVDVYVRFGQGVDPYFCLSVSKRSVGWLRGWFSLWNDATAPLLEVTGRCPTVEPYRGVRVAKNDLCKL
jgi:hypothetical protein